MKYIFEQQATIEYRKGKSCSPIETDFKTKVILRYFQLEKKKKKKKNIYTSLKSQLMK